jgi:hypothetical protein
MTMRRLKRLFDKINRVAANLGYARTAADGAGESEDSQVRGRE